MRSCKKYLLLLGLLLMAAVGGCGGIGYEETDENKPVTIKGPEGLPTNPIMRLKLKSGGCLVIMCSPDFRYLIRLILLRSRVIKWLPDFLISCRIFWNSIFPELTTILPTILWKACCVR